MRVTLRGFRARKGWVVGCLGVILFGLLLLCAGMGAVPISPLQTASILAAKLNLGMSRDFGEHHEAILFSIRLPRVLLAVLVGSGLAAAGTAMQGVFRNPLADPGLMGVSSGSALAAVAAIVLGDSALKGIMQGLGPFGVPIASFLGGLLSVSLIGWLSREEGRISSATMLLSGIAINALNIAGIGYFTFLATDAQLRNLSFWSLGSLGGASWPSLAVIAPLILGSVLALLNLSRPLNTLVLGEAEATFLGTSVERTKFVAVVLSALLVGVAVSASGIIGFVGLVIPHLMRLVLGPDHRWLLPGSALAGSCLLLLADLLARTVSAPAELPIGIVTSSLGAPFFLYMMLRSRRQAQWI